MHAYTVTHELSPQSDYSPGIVQNQETLLRAMFQPEHIVDGKVIVTAIALEDLKDRGFSIDRFSCACRTKLESIINQQMTKKPDRRQACTIARFLCHHVREIHTSEGERAFLVIDTACHCHISHASIYAARPHGKAYLRQLRGLLVPILQDHTTVDILFGRGR